MIIEELGKMPYKSEKIKISGTQFDRRRKLSEDDKKRILELRKTDGFSQRKLAALFGVSRRLIQYILDPAKLQRNKEIHKPHIYTKEEWAEVMRNHRKYKQQLYIEGKI